MCYSYNNAKFIENQEKAVSIRFSLIYCSKLYLLKRKHPCRRPFLIETGMLFQIMLGLVVFLQIFPLEHLSLFDCIVIISYHLE